MERCPSGLRCTPGTRVWMKIHREFESPPLRKNEMFMKIKNLTFLLLILTSFLLSQNKIAVVHFVEGDPIIKNSIYNGRSIELAVGRTIYDGDIIKVNENSSCFIRFLNNKTHVKLFSNSILRIMGDEKLNKIELIKGNLYIKNLYEEDSRTYVFTENNQIYLSNHRVWLSTNKDDLDQIYSLDTPVDIYNNYIKNQFNVKNKHLLSIKKDDFVYIDNPSKFVPNYVLSDNINYNYKQDEMKIEKYDLIPIYGKRVIKKDYVDPFNISLDFGTKFLNTTTHLKLGLYPQYQRKNLFISMDIESYVSPNNNDIKGDWNDFFDIIDKINLSYINNDSNKDMNLSLGSIENISFGTGYLLNDINNTIDYPRRRYSGLNLNYKFDIDFIDFQLIIPSFRDFQNSGGIIASRTSLFISHNFPLTLGLGFVADMNQFSNISNYLKIDSKKRFVYGAEFDFNYNLVSNLDFKMDIFGEAVGLWYPDYNYYILSDDEDISDDLRWRKGTWGFNAPGVSLKFDNRYLIQISLNYNSATFIPNYFNSTYLYNRARYYKANLESIQFNNDFPIVQKQINAFNNNFLVKCNTDSDAECEYLIPKDVYPTLFSNNGFSVYDTYGLTTKFTYNFHSYIDIAVKTSAFIEDSNASNTYFTFQTDININNGYIRNLNKLNFYYSNIFFNKFSDNHRMNYGVEAEVILPMRLSLIINLGQVYYDSNNIIDNNIDRMTNSSIGLKYNF